MAGTAFDRRQKCGSVTRSDQALSQRGDVTVNSVRVISSRDVFIKFPKIGISRKVKSPTRLLQRTNRLDCGSLFKCDRHSRESDRRCDCAAATQDQWKGKISCQQ